MAPVVCTSRNSSGFLFWAGALYLLAVTCSFCWQWGQMPSQSGRTLRIGTPPPCQWCQHLLGCPPHSHHTVFIFADVLVCDKTFMEVPSIFQRRASVAPALRFLEFLSCRNGFQQSWTVVCDPDPTLIKSLCRNSRRLKSTSHCQLSLTFLLWLGGTTELHGSGVLLSQWASSQLCVTNTTQHQALGSWVTISYLVSVSLPHEFSAILPLKIAWVS